MDAYPTLLIGTGDVGGEMVRRAHRFVAKQHPDAARLPLRSLLLSCEGLTFFEEAPRDCEGKDLTTWEEPLDSEQRPGVWSDNYERTRPQRRHIGSALERVVRSVQQLSVKGSAGGLGTKASQLNIYVVSSMVCPVGAATLELLLGQLAETFAELFPGLQHQIQVVLLAPDLLPVIGKSDEAREQAHVRAYTLLQELEEAFDSSRASEVELTWLLSSQNANGFFVESYHDLFPVLGRHVEAMMGGHILQDQSFAIALQQKSGGKTRRYSTFGHARLVFPRRRLLESTLGAAVHRALQAFPGLERRPIEADEAYALTKTFVQEEEWNRLAEALQASTHGEDLWRPFSPPAQVRNEERPDLFLQRLDQYAEGYKSDEGSRMQRAIGQRKAELVQEQRRAVLERVYAFLDENDNGTARALAWLAALEGRASEYIQGDIESFPVTLRALDKEVKGFFDRHFSSMLFGDDDEEEAEPRDRRERLRTLRFDLTTKRRNREHEKRKAARLTADLGDLPPATPNLAPFRPSRPAQGDIRKALQEPQRLSTTDTSYDQVRRHSEVKVAQEDERRRLKRDLESARTNAEALEVDIERMEREEARLADEVNELDRVIGDASERRHLFAPLVEEDREAIAESREEFRETAKGARRQERRLNSLQSQRWTKLFHALAWPVASALLLVSVLWWSVTSLPQRLAAPLPNVLKPLVQEAGWLTMGGEWFWGLSGGLLLAALLVGGFRFWVSYGRVQRSLRRELDKHQQREAGHRRTLIQKYRRQQRKHFKRQIYGSLVDWREEVGSLIRELRKELEGFPDALVGLAARAESRAQDVEVSSRQFVRYVVPPNGTADLLERRSDQLAVRIDECWATHPPSKVFKQFRSGNASPPLRAFGDTLRNELLPVFDDLREVSLVAFMKEAYPDEAARQRHVVQAFERAAALASPQQTYSQVEEKTYAGVRAVDEADRFVKGTLAEVGVGNLTIFQGSSDEVTFFRLMLAFAAFQFTPARRGRTYLHRREPQERAAFYLRPEGPHLPDLLPSVHRLGTASDAARQLACLSLAYGVAERREKENGRAIIAFDGEAYSGYEAWVNHLKTAEGTPTRRDLEQRLEQLQKSNANSSKHYRRLAGSRGRSWVDPIDQEIIEQEMERHSEV